MRILTGSSIYKQAYILYDLSGMKTLSGADNATFDNVVVEENQTVQGNLTVGGTIIGNITAPSFGSGFFNATNTTKQYRTPGGTLDLVGSGSASPVVRVLNNADSSDGSTVQAGCFEGTFTTDATKYTTQTNASTGTNSGSGFRAITDGTGKHISMIAYGASHSTNPGKSLIQSTLSNGLTINSTPPASTLAIQVGSTDKLTITNTAINTGNTLSCGNLTTTQINDSGTLTVTGTSTLNGAVLTTDATPVTGAGTGSVRASGGIYSAKEIMGNLGLYLPYGQPIGTFGNTLCNTYLKSAFALSGGVSNDGVYLYTPGSTAGSASANNTTDYVLAANSAQVKLKQTTASTTTTTGALVVAGGVGIAGNLNVGGSITGGSISYGTTTTGTMAVTSSTNSTSTSTGALTVVGGAGIGGNLYVGGTLVAGAISYSSTTTGTMSVTSVTNISDLFSGAGGAGFTLSGALQVAGGVSIAKDVFINGDLGTRILRLLMPSGGQFSGAALWPNSNGASGTEWLAGLNAVLNPSVGNVYQIKQVNGNVGLEVGPKGSLFSNALTTGYTQFSSTLRVLSVADGQLIFVTGTGNKTVRLPDATTYDRIGVQIKIVNMIVDSVTSSPNSTLTITDAASVPQYYLTSQYQTVTLVCTNIGSAGGVWQVSDQSGGPVYQSGNPGAAYTVAAHQLTHTANPTTGGMVNTAFVAPNMTNNQTEVGIVVGKAQNPTDPQSAFVSYIHDSNVDNRKARFGLFGGSLMEYYNDGGLSFVINGPKFYYQEGYLTPFWAVDPGLYALAVDYDTQYAKWVRNGSQVTVTYLISFSYDFTGSNAYPYLLDILPFAPANNISFASRIPLGGSELSGLQKGYTMDVAYPKAYVNNSVSNWRPLVGTYTGQIIQGSFTYGI